MPHKKKPGIAVIISIGKKPKPDMKKYVGDAMPNVMNKAWGFLKALPEQQAFRQTQYYTRPDGSEWLENSPPHTIHPAIVGLMDRTQPNPNPHEAFSIDRRIIPNTKAEGMIQEIHGLDDEDVETLPPPSGSPQDTINALERDRTMSEAEAMMQRWWPKSRNVNSPLGTLPEHWKLSPE